MKVYSFSDGGAVCLLFLEVNFMACLLVPAAEAIVAAVGAKVLKTREMKAPKTGHADVESVHIPFSRKLRWLSFLQFGGAFLLAFEHVWHGEIVPWFPFLTAMSDSASAMEMLHEMATVGVGMALLTTAVWGAMLAVVHSMEKKAAKRTLQENE